MDGLLTLVDYTPQTVLGITILLVLTGRLLPRFVYQEKVKENDYLKETLKVTEEAREVSDAQTKELLEITKTTQAFIKAALIVKEGGESNVVSPPTQH